MHPTRASRLIRAAEVPNNTTRFAKIALHIDSSAETACMAHRREVVFRRLWNSDHRLNLMRSTVDMPAMIDRMLLLDEHRGKAACAGDTARDESVVDHDDAVASVGCDRRIVKPAATVFKNDDIPAVLAPATLADVAETVQQSDCA
ncbi:hypothetical protein VI03_27780 [Burkholderia vietnamiensis]|nr:hypothetical protein VI03_27780 [Burkholderia vietnamiensis]